MADKQVTYHRDAPYEPLVLEVLKIRGDGTLDIGTDGKPLVTQCPISETPKPGYCTPIIPVPEPPLQQQQQQQQQPPPLP